MLEQKLTKSGLVLSAPETPSRGRRASPELHSTETRRDAGKRLSFEDSPARRRAGPEHCRPRAQTEFVDHC
eukprot:4071384-Pleurochrysis_carterae.AAC.1